MKIPLRTHRESNTRLASAGFISDSQLGLIWVDHIKRPDEVEVVAEMVALRHILRTHVINGNTYLGARGWKFRVSCGAVKRQLLCRSKDTALYRYAAFCSVLASHALLSVWKKAWPDYMPTSTAKSVCFLKDIGKKILILPRGWARLNPLREQLRLPEAGVVCASFVDSFAPLNNKTPLKAIQCKENYNYEDPDTFRSRCQSTKQGIRTTQPRTTPQPCRNTQAQCEARRQRGATLRPTGVSLRQKSSFR